MDEVHNRSNKGSRSVGAWLGPKYSLGTSQKPFLTAVIPARNEGSRLPDTLNRLGDIVAKLGASLEVIVVDDGSEDDTVEVALAHGCQVVHNGTGHGITSAFRKGTHHAKGEFVMLCPADVANFDFLRDVVMLRDGVDIFSVSKRHPKSTVVGYTKFRWIVSDTYHSLVRFLFNVSEGCSDTHYVKLYRRSLLARIATSSCIDGPAGETELIVRSLRKGYSLVEIPGEIHHLQMDSKTSIGLIFRTAMDLVLLWVLLGLDYPHLKPSNYA